MTTPNFDITKLKTSWTKYDIVQVMDVITSIESIESYKNGDIVINEPILKSFLNIKTTRSKIPYYWTSIQSFPKEKLLFSMFSLIFTHHTVIEIFIKSSNNKRGGTMKVMPGHKMYTNIRSALVESGASLPSYRRSKDVPYDFSMLFENGEVGVLAKDLLVDRFSLLFDKELSNEEFLFISKENSFHKALGLSESDFKGWLSGKSISLGKADRYIDSLRVEHFYSIKDADLNLEGSKEVYFLGENGDGKSLILMAFYLAFKGDFVVNETELKESGTVIDLINNAKGLLLTGQDNLGREYGIGKSNILSNLFAYGTHRGRYAKTDNPEKYGFMSLFDIDQTLINPIVWLRNQKMIELEKRLDEKNMLHESKEYPVNIAIKNLENLLFEVLERNVNVKIEIDRVIFIEKGVEISFDQLSEGYRSILIFVIDLLVRLTSSTNQKEIDIKNISGVVLIDEVDQHLHLSWQKVIVHRLREIFPKVQFIMTTHSPTIIQGAGDDAIIFRVFREKESGKTKVSEPVYRKDLDNLMVNSLITHPIFGLETARLDEDNDNADTSDDYLQYRVSRVISAQLEQKRQAGTNFITDEEIDDLIEEIMKKELGNDKN